MKYPYDATYNPPFPAVEVVIRNNDEESLYTEPLPALLDYGSDGTLIPMDYLEEVSAPAFTNARLRSHWGEWRPVQLFLIDLEVSSLRFPGLFVVGDEEGDEIILGRDVLNKLRLLLDGPANQTNVPPQ